LGMLLPIVLPHEIVRLAAIPVGLGLAWLGYALWAEQQKVSESVPAPQLRQARAD
jgi:hypothetical protein